MLVRGGGVVGWSAGSGSGGAAGVAFSFWGGPSGPPCVPPWKGKFPAAWPPERGSMPHLKNLLKIEEGEKSCLSGAMLDPKKDIKFNKNHRAPVAPKIAKSRNCPTFFQFCRTTQKSVAFGLYKECVFSANFLARRFCFKT